jgi:hypothetical protein
MPSRKWGQWLDIIQKCINLAWTGPLFCIGNLDGWRVVTCVIECGAAPQVSQRQSGSRGQPGMAALDKTWRVQMQRTGSTFLSSD